MPARKRPTALTAEKRAGFLAALAAGHTVKYAADSINITRQWMYAYRESDPELARDWDHAIDEGTDVLEQEARRRAVEGTSKPVFHCGVIAGHVQEYSDTLLIF